MEKAGPKLLADLLIDGQRPDNLFGLFFPAVMSFPSTGSAQAALLCSRWLLSMGHKLYRLQHDQGRSAGEERFDSPLGMSLTHGGEVCSAFPGEGWLLLAVDS